MTTTTKAILGIIVVVLAGWAIYGAYQYPKTEEQQNQQVAGSSAGSTFSTAKYYAVTQTFTSSTSTTPILNGDSSDRFASQVRYTCTGIGTSLTPVGGLDNLKIFAATSSSATASTTNTNYMFTGNISTTSTRALVASSTLSLGGTIPTAAWASGSYLWFYTNATNTMTCTIGVDVIPS